MSKLHPIRGQGAADVQPIAADRLVEGAPVAETRLDYTQGESTYVGEWSSGVGAWRVCYDEWEFCHMLEGVCELPPDDGGAPQRYEAGDSFVIEPGFVGVWRVLAPMKKRFVVRIV
jgi:uncharacterized cupin superfamily protein